MAQYHYQIVEFLIRVFAGVLFMAQGYDKLFKVKIHEVINTFKLQAQRRNVPDFVLKMLAYYTSCAEFFGGLLLILGIGSTYALYALGLDLLLIGIAFSVMEPMWDMKHVYPRLILVSALLLFPEEYRLFALNYFFK
ncbi:MAG: DoxX family membrane protein [Bacteroidetes bacterium]|nr:DoxX family membrane protein [Bacteroidota bacterium]